MHPPRMLCIGLAFLVLVSGVGAAAGGIDIDHDGERFILDATADQHVRGTTTFENGTTINVRITSNGETHPFLMSKSTTVGTNGSFDVQFDLTELAPLRGGPVTVALRHNESRIYATNATLVTNNMPENSTLTPDTVESSETTAATTTTESPTPTDIGVPGFGLGATVVALLSAALFVRR
ncbi:BGTF surface domain-containing protein [Haloferax namakaokahaiae]|uniref:BGTF surface domain-containing protein n=1 Tax=Haloferax namakaokahaiae TaxID=1748331 RepID=A0ABD5ZF50_9EURY